MNHSLRQKMIAVCGSLVGVMALSGVIANADSSTVYGPFYASSVTSVPYANGGGGVAWASPGNAAGAPNGTNATDTIGNEQVTEFLKATGFSANIPEGKTVKQVIFSLSKTDPGGFNSSEYLIIPREEEPSNQGESDFVWDNEEQGTPLSVTDVNAGDFGFEWAGYNMGSPGQIAVESISMTVVTD